MIDNEFDESHKALVHCPKCFEKVEGHATKQLISHPKSLIIVFDPHDENESLSRLICDYSSSIDLMDKEYILSGLICQDPVYLDYNVSLRNVDLEHWTQFNKRGISKYSS